MANKNYNKMGHRPALIANLMEMNKDNTDIEIQDFLEMNLQDNLGVRIEAGSSLPKSNALYQNNLMQLYQNGLLGDVSPEGNPIANQQFLSEFGVNEFDSNTNADVRRAKYIVGTPSKTVTRYCSIRPIVSTASKRSFRISLPPRKKAPFITTLPYT